MARVIRGARVIRAAAQRQATPVLAGDERERAELARELREEARAELAAARLEVESARAALLEEAKASLVPVVLAAARRVVGEELEARPERVRAIVAEALDRVRRATRVEVRVHPADAAFLEELGAVLVEDESLERGGCVVESELGEVDARLEVRLDALARALAGSRQ